MKKKLLICSTVVALILCCSVGADTDTQNDPLVTKSYVDQIVAAQVKEQVEEAVVALDIPQETSGSFIVLQVTKGSRIYGDEGTEFILRSGEAYATAGTNGPMIDVTAGIDLAEDMPLNKNHLLLCPRNDGRSIVAQSDIYIMIKGNYELKSN